MLILWEQQLLLCLYPLDFPKIPPEERNKGNLGIMKHKEKKSTYGSASIDLSLAT